MSKERILGDTSINNSYRIMKTAHLIDTPLQLFNTIRYVQADDSNTTRELYIVNQFTDAPLYKKRVEEAGLFSSVKLLERERNGAFKHIWTLLGLIKPNAYCKLIMGIDAEKCNYDSVYLSCPTKMFDFFISASRANTINGIEDGIGSYYGDIYKDRYGSKYQFARKIFKRAYKVDYMFLNSPDLYRGDAGVRLGTIAKHFQRTVEAKRIFFDDEPYFKQVYKILYLNQPVRDIDKNKKEESIIALIKRNTDKKNVKVRIHPRETEKDIYEGMTIDSNKGLWEMSCFDTVDSNSVLIGAFSTAQFTPKLYYNIEPTVVFTFKLYESFSRNQTEDFENMIGLLRESYTDKEKIVVVNSGDDLAKLLKSRVY